jgi:hypothetical protein
VTGGKLGSICKYEQAVEWDNRGRMSSQSQVYSKVGKNCRVPVDEQPTGMRAMIYSFMGLVLQICIEWLVRLSGKRIRKTEAPWLDCVLGRPGVIGTGVYHRIAEEEKLEIGQPPDAGLIPSFECLRGPSFDPERVDARIRHFYEHTALYKLEVWSEVYFAGKFVLWLLVEFISRRMDQLNFPISSLEVAKGMTSEVVQLRNPDSGRLAYTGWLRRFRATGKVIYAGLYSVSQIPGEANPCVKVTFPCFGSSNVYLRPCVYADGTFGLVSTGAAFGRSGFYRVVESGADHWRVRNFTTLHEIFHVYADEDGILRTDHEITFVGLTILKLHYKMTLAQNQDSQVPGEVRSSLQPV